MMNVYKSGCMCRNVFVRLSESYWNHGLEIQGKLTTPSGQKIKDKITHMSLTVQVAVTDYSGLGRGPLNNKILFFYDSEGWETQDKVLADLVSGERAHLLVHT